MHQRSARRSVLRACLVLSGAALMLAGTLPAQSTPETSSSRIGLLLAPLPGVTIAPTARVSGTGLRLSFTASVTGLPAVGRTVLLQSRKGTGLWKTVATTRWSGQGRINLSYVPLAAAAYQYRTVIAAAKGLKAVVGRAIPFTVKPTTNTVGLSHGGGTNWNGVKTFKFSVSAPTGVDTRSRASRKVHLEVRHVGDPTWTYTGLVTTGATGIAAFNVRVSRSGRFEARAVLHAAPGMPSSTSAVVAYSIQPTMVLADNAKSTPISKAALGVGGLLGAAVPEPFGSIRIWDAGVAWNQIETKPNTDPSTWNWTKLDGIVAEAERKGQKLLYVIASTPRFYAADPDAIAMVHNPAAYPLGASQPPTRSGADKFGAGGDATGDPEMNSYRRFVTAVVKRYQGRIEAYQAWNEANLVDYWQGTAAQMAMMTQIVKEVTDANDPSALAVSASIATRRMLSFYPFVDDYLASLKALGSPAEVYSVHLYPYFSQSVSDVMKLAGMFKRVLVDSRVELTGRPIWNTEINYRTNGTEAETATLIKDPLTDSQVRAIVGQIYMRSLSAGISRTYWYGWIQPPTTCTAFCLGIPMWTNTPATNTITRLATWLATPGSAAESIEGCTTNASSLTSCRLTMQGGSHKYIVWSEKSTSTFANVGGAKVTGTHTLEGATLPYSAGVYTANTEPALVDVA
ncbi:MAG: hypothetical protein F2881_02410 [Actinobacteria bacterium]|nr:hypothetical protein [Actinomycetota bacterium]